MGDSTFDDGDGAGARSEEVDEADEVDEYVVEKSSVAVDEEVLEEVRLSSDDVGNSPAV